MKTLLLFNFLGPEMLIILMSLFFFLILIPLVFFIKTLQNTLWEISDENRMISPSNLWFLLIPFIGNIYLFIVVSKMSESLGLEFKKRGINIGEDKPGYSLGLAMSFLLISFFIPLFLLFIRLTLTAGFICWIIYWVRISNYKKLLLNNPVYIDSTY